MMRNEMTNKGQNIKDSTPEIDLVQCCKNSASSIGTFDDCPWSILGQSRGENQTQKDEIIFQDQGGF